MKLPSQRHCWPYIEFCSSGHGFFRGRWFGSESSQTVTVCKTIRRPSIRTRNQSIRLGNDMGSPKELSEIGEGTQENASYRRVRPGGRIVTAPGRMDRTSGVWSSTRSSHALHLGMHSGHFVIVAGSVCSSRDTGRTLVRRFVKSEEQSRRPLAVVWLGSDLITLREATRWTRHGNGEKA